jgi:hypothetical protein
MGLKIVGTCCNGFENRVDLLQWVRKMGGLVAMTVYKLRMLHLFVLWLCVCVCIYLQSIM